MTGVSEGALADWLLVVTSEVDRFGFVLLVAGAAAVVALEVVEVPVVVQSGVFSV